MVAQGSSDPTTANLALSNAEALSDTERISIWAFAGLYFPERAALVAQEVALTLEAMEQQFGERDPECVISRIDYINCHGYVNFPGYPDKHAIIYLSTSALAWARQGNMNPTYSTLAHECVHLLSPVLRRDDTVLEEGIACCFQQEYMKSRHQYEWSPRMASYRRAQELVRRLLADEPYLIRHIRGEEPVLARVTASLIRHYSPKCTTEMADALVQRFVR